MAWQAWQHNVNRSYQDECFQIDVGPMCFELERLPDTPENWNSWCLVQYRNPAENSIFPDRSTGIDINRPAAEAMPVARRMIAENLRRLADEIENATDEIVGTYR